VRQLSGGPQRGRPSVRGMFDLAAIAIGLACFAALFLLLYVLERV
jgi:hypothetical protein